MWPNGQRNINSPSPFQSAAAAANYTNPTNRLQAVMNAAGNPYNQMVASYAPSPYDRSNTLSRNPAMDYASMQKIQNQFSTGSFYNTTAAAVAHNPYDLYRQNSSVAAPNFSDLNRSNGGLMSKDPLAHSASAYSNLFTQGFGSSGTEPLLSGLTARDYGLSLNPAISQDVVSSVFESSLISHGQQQHQQQQHLQQAAHAQQQAVQQQQQQQQQQQHSAQSSAQTVAQQQQHQRAAAAAAAAHLELQQAQQQPQQASPLAQTAAPQPSGNARRNSQGASNQHSEKNRHASDPYSCQQQNKVPQATSQVQKQLQQAQPQQTQQTQLQNPPSVPSHAPGSVDAVAQSPRQPQSIASYHSPAEHTPQTPKTPRILTFSDELRHLATIIEKCGSPSQATEFTSRSIDVVAISEKLNKYTGITKMSIETQTANSAEDELFIVDAEVKEFCRNVPRELVIRASKAPQGGIRLGVWGREEIPSASEFGPFKGRLCQSGTIVPDTADDHWLVRSLRSSNTYYFLPDSINPPPRWMMFINSGYSEQGIEPNCFLLFQSDNEYIIRVMCSIQPETEVLICVNEDLLPNHLLVSPIVEAPKEKLVTISPTASSKRPLPPIAIQEHNPESETENLENMSDQGAETDSEQLPPTPAVKVKSKNKKKKKGGKKSSSQSASPIAKEVHRTIYFEDIPFYITHNACRDCKKYFLECSAYETHRKSYHEDNLPWRCKLCDAIGYKELGKLKSHYKKEHDKEDKILYFDKCRNEAIELSYQVDFEQDLSEFVEYELFSGARKLKSKRKLPEKPENIVDSENQPDCSAVDDESVPERKKARIESEKEVANVEMEEKPDLPQEEEEIMEENQDDNQEEDDEEEEIVEDKPAKHSKGKKGSSKKDKSGKGKKKKAGKKGSSKKGNASGSTELPCSTRKTSPRRSAHRQSEIEISIEDDDGSEIKMKFDADDDDYMNDEEFMQNLHLNASNESDPDYGNGAQLPNSKKKKKKNVKGKKGKKKPGQSPKIVEEELEIEIEPEQMMDDEEEIEESQSPLPVPSSTRSSGKSSKGRPRKDASQSPVASKSPTKEKSQKEKESKSSKSKSSPKGSKGRGRSKTPTKSNQKAEENTNEVDEKVIAEILANESKKFPSQKVKEATKSLNAEVEPTSNDAENCSLTDQSKMSPEIKKKPEKKFECHLCLDKFIMVAKFERHMTDVHKIEKPWKCESCEMSFKRYFLMSQHVKMRHADDNEDEEEERISSQSDRCSENDVSGVEQSENDGEPDEMPLAHNLVNKPLAHYNPLDHLKHKHSNNILPPPVLSNKTQPVLKQESVEAAADVKTGKFKSQNEEAWVQKGPENEDSSTVDYKNETSVSNSTAIYAQQQSCSMDAETSQALQAIAEFSSEQILLQGDYGNSTMDKEFSSSGKGATNNDVESLNLSESHSKDKDKKRKLKVARTFVCEHCDPQVEFNHANRWSKHLAEKHDIKKPFKCELCSKSFSSQQALDNHVKRCGTGAGEASSIDPANSALRCNKCNIEIKSMKQYTLHMSGDHSSAVPYLCQLCTYQFPRASVLAEHLRSAHSVVVKESQLVPLTCSPMRQNEPPPTPDKTSSPSVTIEPVEKSIAAISKQSIASESPTTTTTPVKKKSAKNSPKISSNPESISNVSLNPAVVSVSNSHLIQSEASAVAIQPENVSSNPTLAPQPFITTGSEPKALTISVAAAAQNLSETTASMNDSQGQNGDKKPKQTQCQICFKWMDKNYFQDHMNLHNGNKPYECEICKQRFAQRAGLAYHKKNQHSSTPGNSGTSSVHSGKQTTLGSSSSNPVNPATSLIQNGNANLSSNVPIAIAPVMRNITAATTLASGSSLESTGKNVTTGSPTVAQTFPLMELNGQTLVATTTSTKPGSQNQSQSKPVAPAVPTKAMEMILHKNRTILPASAKPAAVAPVIPAAKNSPQPSAIIIPATSAGKTTFQLASDGKQTPVGANFILTPFSAGKANSGSIDNSMKQAVSTTKPIAPKKQGKPANSSGSKKSTSTGQKKVLPAPILPAPNASEVLKALNCSETLGEPTQSVESSGTASSNESEKHLNQESAVVHDIAPQLDTSQSNLVSKSTESFTAQQQNSSKSIETEGPPVSVATTEETSKADSVENKT